MTATIAEQIRHLADTMATQPPNGAIHALAPVRANLAAAEMPEGVTNVGLIRPDVGLLRPSRARPRPCTQRWATGHRRRSSAGAPGAAAAQSHSAGTRRSSSLS
jgi:hypothetical protein